MYIFWLLATITHELQPHAASGKYDGHEAPFKCLPFLLRKKVHNGRKSPQAAIVMAVSGSHGLPIRGLLSTLCYYLNSDAADLQRPLQASGSQVAGVL